MNRGCSEQGVHQEWEMERISGYGKGGGVLRIIEEIMSLFGLHSWILKVTS